MQPEDELRAGLRTMADHAPTGGDATAVRTLGQRRLRSRRLIQAGVAVAAISTAGVIGVALAQQPKSSTIDAAGPEPTELVEVDEGPTTTASMMTTTTDSDLSESTAPVTTVPEASDSAETGDSTTMAETSVSTTTDPASSASTSIPLATTTTSTEFPVDPNDPSAPTQAAIDADEAFRQVPPDHQDCGSLWTTAGYPTTTAPWPDTTECIAAAFRDGVASQYSHSARDFNGGTTGAIYRVNPDGSAELIRFNVNPAGTVRSTAERCTQLLASPDGVDPDCVR